MDEKKISRAELHAEIWQRPMTQLAADWGVPIAGIMKACEQMNVPRPGPGHWRLVGLGWKMESVPLPVADAKAPDSTVIKSVQQKSSLKQVSGAISDLRLAHPLVQGMHAVMKTGSVIQHGPVAIGEGAVFNVRVSRRQVRRAMLFLDVIVRELERRGATFEIESWPTKHRIAAFKAGTVDFAITEEMKRERVLVKREPIGAGFMHHYEWHYRPTGKLTFSIREQYPKHVRKNWHDCPRHRVEDKLAEIVEQMCVNPARGSEQFEQLERARNAESQQRYLDYLRNSAPQRLDEMQKELQREIEEQSAAWQKAMSVRSFLSSCEARMRASNSEMTATGWETRWLNWGKEWVDGLDPLTNGFLEQLKGQFGKLEALECFVAERKRDKGVAGSQVPSSLAKP